MGLSFRDWWPDDDRTSSMVLLLSRKPQPLALGKVVASIRCHHWLSSRDRGKLAHEIGTFADVARCATVGAMPMIMSGDRGWQGLAPSHQFRLVLVTAGSHRLGATEMEVRLLHEDESAVAVDFHGYLHALPNSFHSTLNASPLIRRSDGRYAKNDQPCARRWLGSPASRWKRSAQPAARVW